MILTLLLQDYDVPIDFSSNPYYEEKFKFYDRKLERAISGKDDQVMEFFTLLALCHTIMPEEKEGRGCRGINNYLLVDYIVLIVTT